MTSHDPQAELQSDFSSDGATAEPWSAAVAQLHDAEVFWISTVRPDGRPHVTPLIAVWDDDGLWFTTGETERKARNLAQNPSCILTTGCNRMGEGLDVVLEGQAVRVQDEAALQALADAYIAKYGEGWRFVVRDGAFTHEGLPEGSVSLAFRLDLHKGLGFRRGDVYSQTRWRVGGP